MEGGSRDVVEVREAELGEEQQEEHAAAEFGDLEDVPRDRFRTRDANAGRVSRGNGPTRVRAPAGGTSDKDERPGGPGERSAWRLPDAE